jgi:uncharacterized membrane protein YfcA
VFPSLLFAGIPAVSANATTTCALWPASLASAGAYRKDLPRDRRVIVALAAASLAGGALGGLLLLRTSERTFNVVLPWLMLVAALVFTAGPRIARYRASARVPLVAGALVQLVIATYGGYFGGGMGFLMLATYTLMGMTDIHAMNGLKTIAASMINGVANVLFLVANKVVLLAALPVALGSITGGWAGAALARRVDAKHVRRFVLLVAWALTAYFFYRSVRR